MKKILLAIALLSLSGCGVVTGTQYLSGTVVGLKAGLPDGVSLVIGYQRYEAVQCETEANINIGLEGKAGMTGMEGKSHAKFGKAANE